MVTWNPFAVSIAILCVMKLDFLFCCISILGQEGYLPTWNNYLECEDPSFLLLYIPSLLPCIMYLCDTYQIRPYGTNECHILLN